MTDADGPEPDEPLGHLLRPTPPWHTEGLTECGRPASDVARMTTAEEVRKLVDRHGRKRAAFLTCITCWETAGRHSHARGGSRVAEAVLWETAPDAVLARLVEGLVWSRNEERREQINRELTALGVLYEAHRDEFDELVAGLGATVSLDDQRARSAAREATRHPKEPRRPR